MDTGLCIDHASPNLFGPMPKTGLSESTPLVMERVAGKEGLTSLIDICRRLGITLPIKLGDMKNNRETIATKKEARGNCLLSCSSFSSPSLSFPKVVDIL